MKSAFRGVAKGIACCVMSTVLACSGLAVTGCTPGEQGGYLLTAFVSHDESYSGFGGNTDPVEQYTLLDREEEGTLKTRYTFTSYSTFEFLDCVPEE